MRFLKNNIFYVGLVLAMVLIGGAILLLRRGLAKENDESQQKRQAAVAAVASLAHKPLVNQQVLDALKYAVTRDRQEGREVAEQSARWNRMAYNLLELPKYEGDRKVGTVPAFPIDAELYDRHALRFHFAREYNRQLAASLGKLNAIAPPSDEEIAVAVLRAEDRLRQAAKREADRREALESRETPPEAGRMRAPGPDAMGLRPRGVPGPDTSFVERSGGSAERFRGGEQAKQEGFAAAVTAKAQTGLIYAVVENLNPAIAPSETGADDKKLFSAQVGLWITRDILEAIRLTIRDSLRTPDGKVLAATVLNSAVKRLVTLDVDEDFVVGPAGSGAAMVADTTTAPARRKPKKRRALPMGRRGLGNGRPMSAYGTGPYSAAGAGGGRSAPGGGGKPGAAQATLTRRVSNPRYDVKHYSFTVIMDNRYVPLLGKHLMARNFHTILASTFEEVEPDESEGYYYGTSPVMKVTIEGELLLLTAWERGTWVPGQRGQTGNWSQQYPPIMPRDVLVSIASRDGTALRSEDRIRAGIVAAGATGRFPKRR